MKLRAVSLGRLGNVLFQYACLYSLQKEYALKEIIFDVSWYDSSSWQEVCTFLQKQKLLKITNRIRTLPSRFVRKLFNKHYWQYVYQWIEESRSDVRFKKIQLEHTKSPVLFGYFQSELYFKKYSDELRAHLLALLNDEVISANRNHATCAIHVRRGDFLLHPQFLVCDENYYHAAMKRVKSHDPHVKFEIFSDDPDWCRDFFCDNDCAIIDCDREMGGELRDLVRMSKADHHIIANSSYSWWAAWLGKKENQKVIIPSRWFNGEPNAPIEEKLCEGWEIVS